MAHNHLRLTPNRDGTYDLVIQYDRVDTEFAMDFFSSERIAKRQDNISDFLKKNAKNIKISAVRFMIAGIIVAAIPFTAFAASAAEPEARYSMAYLYGGTVQQQLGYVERTGSSLQTVSPSYFDLNADGSLKLNPVSTELVGRMHANGIKVVPFLSNHWDRTVGINALKDVDKLSTQIADLIKQYDLDGVNVDIENVTEQQRSQYTELVRLLRAKIPAPKEVSVATAANPKGWTTGWHGSYDYTALGQNSDYLMMMTYDEHYEGGTAGPVASIGFVENSIKYALSKTNADKIVVGLPFFGRIWSVNDASVIGKGLGISTINSMIKDYNAVITYDTTAQSPKAEFEVKAGDKQYMVGGKALAPGKYVVWYENDQSIQAKLSLVQKHNLKGAGSWALGQEDISIWNNYNTWLNGENQQITQPSEHILYTVAAGDSLWKISQNFDVTVDIIKSLNDLNSDAIFVGQQLKIPVTVPDVRVPPATPPAFLETPAWVTGETISLNVRQTPDLAGTILTTLNGGTQVTITGSPLNGFYPIRLADGRAGYVSVNYLTTDAPVTTLAPSKQNPEAFTIKFNSKGGSNVSQKSGVATNSKISKPGDPKRKGFIFDGWYKEAGYKNKWNFAKDTVKDNTTLYAKWTAVTAKITPTTNKVSKGKTLKLKLTGNAAIKSVKWTTSNKNNVSFTGSNNTGCTVKGLIKGKNATITAVITFKDGTKKTIMRTIGVI